ncbi:transposase family protein [Streptomyces cadmiisoli]|uniref:transposase family protein n=1 Tax=Streptomyces cadmiisoli TaxID=2184053 RepID=UPI003D76417E
MEFSWYKRRWWCRGPKCPRESFTESPAQTPAGARITTRLRQGAGSRVRDAVFTVIQAARDLHLSWPTVMGAFRTTPHEAVAAPLPEVEVMGIDQARRGKTKWERDRDSGKWRLTRDRWHTVSVDALGQDGLLGRVEGGVAPGGLPPRELRDLQHRIRAEQHTPDWKVGHTFRSGVEGTSTRPPTAQHGPLPLPRTAENPFTTRTHGHRREHPTHQHRPPEESPRPWPPSPSRPFRTSTASSGRSRGAGRVVDPAR